MIDSKHFDHLLQREMFRGFEEEPIIFQPTHKYVVDTNQYDGAKRRLISKEHSKSKFGAIDCGNAGEIVYFPMGNAAKLDLRKI